MLHVPPILYSLKFGWENLKERQNLGELDADGGIILKWILEE
jgi:hypothetical protein